MSIETELQPKSPEELFNDTNNQLIGLIHFLKTTTEGYESELDTSESIRKKIEEELAETKDINKAQNSMKVALGLLINFAKNRNKMDIPENELAPNRLRIYRRSIKQVQK